MATIFTITEVGDNYELAGKKIMVHDLTAINGQTTLKIDASYFAHRLVLPEGTVSYYLPANTLLKALWFQGGSAATIGVGTSPTTNDLFDSGDLAEDGDLVFEGIKPFRNRQLIYFNGVASDTVTIIFK